MIDLKKAGEKTQSFKYATTFLRVALAVARFIVFIVAFVPSMKRTLSRMCSSRATFS